MNVALNVRIDDMNSHDRKVENRIHRHQERQELERQLERFKEGEDPDLPRVEKRSKKVWKPRPHEKV